MHYFGEVLFLILFSICLATRGESSNILCIDGGESKTILQIVDQSGQLLSLTKNGVTTDQVQAVGANINVVGIEGVRTALKQLFENVQIGESQQDLISIIPECQVVAGIAGTALPENKLAIISLFEEWGILQDHVFLLSDAELALQLMKDEGIILISGTGSICLGKKNRTIFRIGGLGRVIGDEGSGYQIGIQAFKAALEEEYGWGDTTSLTPILKELFHVAELKSLIPYITRGEAFPAKIASVAPFVFEEAAAKDAIAERIIERAATDLRQLLIKMLKVSHLSNCEVHLWGGVFQNLHTDAFIEKMMEHPLFIQRNLKILNQSHQNPSVLFASGGFLQKNADKSLKAKRAKIFSVEPEKSLFIMP